MSSFSDKKEVTTLSAETVSIADQRKLVIDEDVAESFHFPNPPMIPDFYVAEREEECVKQALEKLNGEAEDCSHAECATERNSKEEEKSFVDNMGGSDIEAGGELEGFTFANTMLWADLLSQTILKGV